jgi:Putative zinc-finger
MTCGDARDMFSLLADDALTPLERAALDAHLAECAECRRELAGFERTVKLIRAIDPEHAPAGFVERVLAAAQAAPLQPQPAPLPEQPAALPEQPAPLPEQPAPLPQQPAPLPRRPARRMAWRRPTVPLSAAALLVVGGLAVLLFRGSPEQQRAAQRQLDSPPAVTAPAPRTDAPPIPAPPSRELQKPAAPAGERVKSAPTPPTAARKRAETRAEPKLSDEQRNVTPPQAAEPFGAKSESSEREKDKRDVAQDAVQQTPASPARERHAAAAKAQPTPQTSALSRTGPMTGIPAATPDVRAQLRVADVSAAERSLIQLATRVGGRQTGRRIDAGRIVVELTLPRDAYAQFVREATALGAMSIESQAAERPMLAVAVTVSN